MILTTDVINCLCTTEDCYREGRVTCQARSFCYVQLTPISGLVQATKGIPRVIRGCVDTRTPLLCENRRPTTHEGLWPVLHCCREDWCNALVVPTAPAWAEEEVKGEQSCIKYFIKIFQVQITFLKVFQLLLSVTSDKYFKIQNILVKQKYNQDSLRINQSINQPTTKNNQPTNQSN